MAELTVRLRPVPGGTEVVISLTEDEDGLPHEHEARHRDLVTRLLGEDAFPRLLAAGRVSVERVKPAAEPVPG